jgi:hypothetical protein
LRGRSLGRYFQTQAGQDVRRRANGGLLADALPRALASARTVGLSMVVVDALDEGAAGFHAAHGFMRLPESLRLVLPMRVIERMVVSV